MNLDFIRHHHHYLQWLHTPDRWQGVHNGRSGPFRQVDMTVPRGQVQDATIAPQSSGHYGLTIHGHHGLSIHGEGYREQRSSGHLFADPIHRWSYSELQLDRWNLHVPECGKERWLPVP